MRANTDIRGQNGYLLRICPIFSYYWTCKNEHIATKYVIINTPDDTAARALVVKVNDENIDQMDIWCRKTQMSYLFLNFYE